VHALQLGDVGERIALDGDDIGELPTVIVPIRSSQPTRSAACCVAYRIASSLIANDGLMFA